MKKLALLLSLVLLGALLAACGGDDEDNSGSDVSGVSEAASDASGSEDASGAEDASGDASAASGDASAADASGADAPASTPAPQPAAPTVAGMAGRFVCYNEDRYPDARAPILDLSDKGGFVFTFNTGEGEMDVLTGTFELSGTSMILDVLYKNGEDYLGQDLGSVSFTMIDEYTLDYASGALGLTRQGDRFLRVGAPPSVAAVQQEPAFAGTTAPSETSADVSAAQAASEAAPEAASSSAE